MTLMKLLSSNFSICALISTLVCAVATPTVAQDEAVLYGDDVNAGESIYDPLESINRLTFKLNDVLIGYVFEPVSKIYTTITPDPVEQGASNFFRNLRYPIRLGGNLLQGRFDGAWVETGRFAINTTLGVVGVLSPADNIEGFEPIPSEDVADALGSWGIGEGPYLVLPFLGPSNLRDLVGLVGDAALDPTGDPFSAVDNWNWEWQTGLTVSEIIAGSPALVDQYNQLKGGSIDPYSAMKNGYAQFRSASIME